MPSYGSVVEALSALVDRFAGGLNIGNVSLNTGGGIVTRIATGAAVQVVAANTARKAVTFRNVHASVVCYIAETSAKATAAAGFTLAVGAQVTFERSTNAWFAFSATAGDLAIVEEA